MHVYSADSRSRAYGVIVTLAVVIAVMIDGLIQTLHWKYDWIISGPTVAAAFGALFQLTDAKAWRWTGLRRIGVIQTPNIDGVWEGTLLSSWNGTEVPVTLRIDQRWTTMVIAFNVRQPTTSTSYSVSASLRESGHTHASLTYTYKNMVRPGIADSDMRDHDGTTDLDFDLRTNTANGRYFNARGRQGTLALVRR